MKVADADVRVLVGSTFEQVAKRIFEGKLHPKRSFQKGDLNPDLESETHDAWVEVKGTQSNRHFKLHPRQIDHYRQLLETPFPYSSVLFAFFAYGLRDIQSTYGQRSVGSLARQIVLYTEYLVVLDFAVVEAVLPTLLKRRFASYGKLYLWAPEINQGFMSDPLVQLHKLGIDLNQFKVERKSVEAKVGRRTKRTIPSVWILKTIPHIERDPIGA